MRNPACACVLAVVAVTGGCATSAGQASVQVWTPEALRAELARRLPAAEEEIILLHEVSSADVERASNAIRWERSRRNKVEALVEAMFAKRHFGLEYQDGTTRTAAETLRHGGGNCLSLASVFVGLARGLGLQAYFADVSALMDDEVHESGDLLVRAGHITGVVTSPSGIIALDVGLRLRPFGLHRHIDDLEATALFYNNKTHDLIVEAHQAGEPVDWDRVVRGFLSAIRVKPELALAWSNLGVGYARLGRVEEALMSYAMASELGAELVSPRLNAGLLLLRERRPAEAISPLREALSLDPDHSRARFSLALALARTGRIDEAIAVASDLEDSRRKRDRQLVTTLQKKRHYYRSR